MNHPPIILASQSPRRKLLLQQIGVTPICQPVDIDESVIEGELPLDYCRRLAIQKAQTAWQRSDQSTAVLGSDTSVVLNDCILGKPKDHKDAFETLMNLSGQSHQVITAVAMINAHKQQCLDSISVVTFAELDAKEVQYYVDGLEPMDKAGSYGIQGYAAVWIKHIAGSHSGIMGLPLYETGQLIKAFT